MDTKKGSSESFTRPTFISTNGLTGISFRDALLRGFADDGGLIVPSHFPSFSPEELRTLSKKTYPDIVYELLLRFVDLSLIPEQSLRVIVDEAFGKFRVNGAVCVKPIRVESEESEKENSTSTPPKTYICELFHGPTLAFKDLALQVMGGMFEHVLVAEGTHRNLVVATSGDTGSSALEAFKGRQGVDIHCLYPIGRVSCFQEKQIRTAAGPNTHVYGVEGTDSDKLDVVVKSLFDDPAFSSTHSLGSVNSFNLVRILVQAAHFIYAYTCTVPEEDLGVAPAVFVIPNGAFGNAMALYFASQMGIRVSVAVIATNKNDAAHLLISQGTFSKDKDISPSVAPAIDIQVPYNIERLFFFQVADRDPSRLQALMKDFHAGSLQLDATSLSQLQSLYVSTSVSDEDILSRMKNHFDLNGETVCPHTAVGIEGYLKLRSSLSLSRSTAESKVSDDSIRSEKTSLSSSSTPSPVILMATAHPAKFLEAVESAVGTVPDHLKSFYSDVSTDLDTESASEVCDTAPSVIEAVLRAHITACSKAFASSK